ALAEDGSRSMTSAWALSVPPSSAVWLSPLRYSTGIGICEQEDVLWLQGKSLDDDLQGLIARIPGALLFEVLKDGQLVRQGQLVPTGWIVSGPWQLFDEWFRQTLSPPSGLTGACEALSTANTLEIHLVRSVLPREATLLQTTLDKFQAYASDAPQWRLERWKFAASADRQVLIQGTPLPPLPGDHWILDDDIAVPAGFRWEPAVTAATLRRVFGLQPGCVALLHNDQSWEYVPAEAWVQCTRSAVRLTVQGTAR
ncbi:MAG TPA: hypothetical protein VF443_08475, partial [Nitrospira sp.]